jgi:hypothetical protein
MAPEFDVMLLTAIQLRFAAGSGVPSPVATGIRVHPIETRRI